LKVLIPINVNEVVFTSNVFTWGAIKCMTWAPVYVNALLVGD